MVAFCASVSTPAVFSASALFFSACDLFNSIWLARFASSSPIPWMAVPVCIPLASPSPTPLA